jgi:threonine-phosphate decarboxylase
MDLLKEVNKRKNPWTINTLAAIAGEIMFTDNDYIDMTRTLIKEERNRICKLLSSCPNLKVYPPSANFVLLKILKEDVTAAELFDTAIRKGFMIRDCSTFPFLDQKFIRFCFMSPEKNTELVELLLDALK